MSNILPSFTTEGVLPIGDYALTLEELRQSHLVTGHGNASPNWDSGWRAELVDNLAILASQLWAVGIAEIFVDGSFVEDRDHPGDIDGYFVVDPSRLAGRKLEQELNRFDPYQIWTWNPQKRIVPPSGGKPQLPMWIQYRVELFPHFPGLYSGITDQYGNQLSFPAAFRKSRLFQPKGIIALRKET